MNQFRLPLLNIVKGLMRRLVAAALFSGVVFNTTRAQSLIPELVFMNPQLKTGNGYPGDGADGAVYIFSNVADGMDALVTIQGRSSSEVTLSNIDLKGPEQDPSGGTGLDNAWQPKVNFGDGSAAAHSSWWMEFRIVFVRHEDSGQPALVNQFFVSGLDIDGDGDGLREFQSFYKAQHFTMNRHSMMTYASVKGCLNDRELDGKKFDGTIKNYQGISTDAPDAMVNNFYNHTNNFVVRLGAETGSAGSHSTGRMYALWFKSLTCDVPVNAPLPVSLIAFNGQLKNGRVNLNWTTGIGRSISHFTLQRSLDGKEFEDHAVVLTEGDCNVRKDYQFPDELPEQNLSMIYYRLKMTDMNAGIQYSEVVPVRIHPVQQQKLLVYSNPHGRRPGITDFKF
jgi:hypothetical protein